MPGRQIVPCEILRTSTEFRLFDAQFAPFCEWSGPCYRVGADKHRQGFVAAATAIAANTVDAQAAEGRAWQSAVVPDQSGGDLFSALLGQLLQDSAAGPSQTAAAAQSSALSAQPVAPGATPNAQTVSTTTPPSVPLASLPYVFGAAAGPTNAAPTSAETLSASGAQIKGATPATISGATITGATTALPALPAANISSVPPVGPTAAATAQSETPASAIVSSQQASASAQPPAHGHRSAAQSANAQTTAVPNTLAITAATPNPQFSASAAPNPQTNSPAPSAQLWPQIHAMQASAAAQAQGSSGTATGTAAASTLAAMQALPGQTTSQPGQSFAPAGALVTQIAAANPTLAAASVSSAPSAASQISPGQTPSPSTNGTTAPSIPNAGTNMTPGASSVTNSVAGAVATAASAMSAFTTAVQSQAQGQNPSSAAAAGSAQHATFTQATNYALHQSAASPVTEAKAIPLHIDLGSQKDQAGSAAQNANQSAQPTNTAANTASQSSAPGVTQAAQTPHDQPAANTPVPTAAGTDPSSINGIASSATQQARPQQPAATTSFTLQVAPSDQSAQQIAAPNVHALAVSIAAQNQTGTKQFDIRLDPPELGRVDVKLTVDATGKAQAHLAADKPQTLELLQKDSSTLARALRDSGVQLGNNGLQFSLKGQGRQGTGTPSRGRTLSVSAVAGTSSSANSASSIQAQTSGVDITV